jgi:acetyl esterase/lipase
MPRFLSVLFLTLLCLTSSGRADPAAPAGFIALRDFDYAGLNHPRQKLDLYLPEKPADKPLPLIVYIHGGGWEAGDKTDTGLLFELIKNGGWAGASIGYTLSQDQKWPAQIHDVKAAVRWLGRLAKRVTRQRSPVSSTFAALQTSSPFPAKAASLILKNRERRYPNSSEAP